MRTQKEYTQQNYKTIRNAGIERVQEGIALPKNTAPPIIENEEWERELYENPSLLSESLGGTNRHGRVNNIRPRW
jgi:hypothetical protein